MSAGAAAGAVRTMVLWCPDWPVAATAEAEGLTLDDPIAVIEKGLVYACSEGARSDGVRRGLRLREAQARSPRLRDFPYDPVRVNRAFEPLIGALEEMSPNVQVMRAGSCALRARGPKRFYGTEHVAALAFLERFAELGVTEARVGVADGLFAAEQAARLPGVDLIRIVPEGASPEFLARLPLQLLGEEELCALLWRLGIRTLGDFAALPAEDVRSRFGEPGARAHERASGTDPRRVVPRIPPEVRESVNAFEPPLERIDQITFSIRAEADRFVGELAAARLVCTELRVEIATERGEVRERTWLHPRWFGANDVVDRVRWQLQGGSTIESTLSAPVVRVRLTAETVDDSARHETGLWGTGSEERIHHGLSRVQSIVGHEGVLTASIGGGRSPRERQLLVPWGDRPPTPAAAPGRAAPAGLPGRAASTASASGALARIAPTSASPNGGARLTLAGTEDMIGPSSTSSSSATPTSVIPTSATPSITAASTAPGTTAATPRPASAGARRRGPKSSARAEVAPWPGSLPPPLPTTVFEQRRQVLLLTSRNELVDVDDSGELIGEPARFSPDVSSRSLRPVQAWAGPWPVSERWWDSRKARRLDRLQLIDADGTAWLLALDRHLWWAEARYD
ncbi:DNA polymerase Y family protein [Herbiconiux sp. CPCC 205716]|uniref:DNA polymerase Y family protein n=1 Tax=Herbiconiux gentiana TaxID=2970912 RepID=A0ABT2GDS5_9MICO|nr:DNA polymerase Y family protein [Herbiconiux gentiana]MCS5713044.1 DNA polymerase Y family protein [Herbiconiux gentiana]